MEIFDGDVTQPGRLKFTGGRIEGVEGRGVLSCDLLVGADIVPNAECALNPTDDRKISARDGLEEEDYFFAGNKARNGRNIGGEISDGTAEQTHGQNLVGVWISRALPGFLHRERSEGPDFAVVPGGGIRDAARADDELSGVRQLADRHTREGGGVCGGAGEERAERQENRRNELLHSNFQLHFHFHFHIHFTSSIPVATARSWFRVVMKSVR